MSETKKLFIMKINMYSTVCNTDKICIFTDTGKMHTIKAVDIPLGRFRDKGNTGGQSQ